MDPVNNTLPQSCPRMDFEAVAFSSSEAASRTDAIAQAALQRPSGTDQEMTDQGLYKRGIDEINGEPDLGIHQAKRLETDPEVRIEILFKALTAHAEQLEGEAIEAIIRFAAKHIDRAEGVLLRLLNAKAQGVSIVRILATFLDCCPMEVGAFHIAFKIHQIFPVDFNDASWDGLRLGENGAYHMIRFLSLIDNEKGDPRARDYLELTFFPFFSIRQPELMIINCPKIVSRAMMRLTATLIYEPDWHTLVDAYRNHEINPADALHIGLFGAPSALFQAFIICGSFLSHPDQIQLLNVFLNHFASLGQSKLPYRLYVDGVLKKRDWIIENKQRLDRVAVLTLIGFSAHESLSQDELCFFSALFDKNTAEALLPVFWKSPHILSLLPIIRQAGASIPLLGILQLKMRKDIPQAQVDKLTAESPCWGNFKKTASISEELKQFNLYPVLQDSHKLIRESFLLRFKLKYFNYLKMKLRWEVGDITKITDADLLGIAKYLKPDDYKYFIPISENPNRLIRLLLENPSYHFYSLPFIRFVNRMPAEWNSLPPVEEIVSGLGDQLGAGMNWQNMEFYFADPKAIREIGIYESRYPGKDRTAKYDEIALYAAKILRNCPMKDSDFNKASFGLELLKLRLNEPRKL